MKLELLTILTAICFWGVSQKEIKTENYRNGNLKSQTVINDGSIEVVKTYYRNGQLKTQQYLKTNIFEQYHKNGQLSYRRINESKIIILEEAYSKQGLLIIRIINDKVVFSGYENAFVDLKGLRHKAEHESHGHSHGHSHDDGPNTYGDNQVRTDYKI